MEQLNIVVHLCTKSEMEEAVQEHGVKPSYNPCFLRGFVAGNEIWIVKDCIGELALLAHEYGHIRGLDHCKFPSIMNFSGLFRWFCVHPSELLHKRGKQ
jgi:hypothetical protein